MSKLKIFENKEFGQIRTITINDEPWFVGRDVAKALGYKNTKDALATHVEECDKIMGSQNATPSIKDSMGREQYPTWINESGLYALIFGSKLESAKRFKHWVTSEVLPAIRKHGVYAVDEVLSNPDMLISALQELKAERAKRKTLETKIEQDKPKVLFADAVTASDTSILIRDYAKILYQNGIKTGEKRLYNWMREKGYIIKGTTQPTQKAMELGLFEVIERSIHRGDDLPLVTHTTRITGKGQVYFLNKLKKEIA